MKGTVGSISMQLYPSGACEECGQLFSGPAATSDARVHVKATGHEVVIERISRSRYYLNKDA